MSSRILLKKSWEELFDGFDSLEAIAYSSGLTFINKVLEKFKTATIILGSDKTISMELNQIMAFQTATLQDLNRLYNKKHSRVHQMLKESSITEFENAIEECKKRGK